MQNGKESMVCALPGMTALTDLYLFDSIPLRQLRQREAVPLAGYNAAILRPHSQTVNPILPIA